jgi:hypothetical protein
VLAKRVLRVYQDVTAGCLAPVDSTEESKTA